LQYNRHSCGGGRDDNNNNIKHVWLRGRNSDLFWGCTWFKPLPEHRLRLSLIS
jgi:hypothetical protein